MSSSIRLPAVEARLAVLLCCPNWLADAAVKSSKCAVVPVVLRAVPAEQRQQVGGACQSRPGTCWRQDAAKEELLFTSRCPTQC